MFSCSDCQWDLPRSIVDYGQSITELEKGFTGLHNYKYYVRDLVKIKLFLKCCCVNYELY